MDEAVGNGGNGEEHRGKEREREALPVCFRCGKRRLPVDSIRASSGYHVKGGGVRKGKTKKKGGIPGVRKGEAEEENWLGVQESPASCLDLLLTLFVQYNCIECHSVYE